jgi:hypothetical protein
MLDLPRMRTFRLSCGGVSCDRDGLFVGSVPLLVRGQNGSEGATWIVRSQSELDSELSACFGLPVDTAAKISGLARVAKALNEDDLAMAAIVALHLQFPDPPAIEKGARSRDDWQVLAAELFWSGLLKGDWDPDKHPRTGEAPNPGWFAPTPKQTPLAPNDPDSPKLFGLPKQVVRQGVRQMSKFMIKIAAKGAVFFLTDGMSLLVEVLMDLAPTPLNQDEQRILDEMRAARDQPKTLEQLRNKPNENALGYDKHHIVEQNPSNVAKRIIEKFGRALIDDPDNLVWVPRLKHENITAYYNQKDPEDPPGRLRRAVFNELSFGAQRVIGLMKLREEGVLK